MKSIAIEEFLLFFTNVDLRPIAHTAMYKFNNYVGCYTGPHLGRKRRKGEGRGREAGTEGGEVHVPSGPRYYPN